MNNARVQTRQDYGQILWRYQWLHSGRVCERIRSGPSDLTGILRLLALDFCDDDGDFGFGGETLQDVP